MHSFAQLSAWAAKATHVGSPVLQRATKSLNSLANAAAGQSLWALAPLSDDYRAYLDAGGAHGTGACASACPSGLWCAMVSYCLPCCALPRLADDAVCAAAPVV